MKGGVDYLGNLVSEMMILGELKGYGGTVVSMGDSQWNFKEQTRDFSRLWRRLWVLSLGERLNTLWKTGRSGYWRVVVKNVLVRVKRRK